MLILVISLASSLWLLGEFGFCQAKKWEFHRIASEVQSRDSPVLLYPTYLVSLPRYLSNALISDAVLSLWKLHAVVTRMDISNPSLWSKAVDACVCLQNEPIRISLEVRTVFVRWHMPTLNKFPHRPLVLQPRGKWHIAFWSSLMARNDYVITTILGTFKRRMWKPMAHKLSKP